MAKDKTGKLPKRIGGIKLPRKGRKQANKAIAALNQPMVRELAAAALAAAAAAAKRRARQSPPATKSAVKTDAQTTPSSGAQLAELAAGIAMAALGKWLANAAAPTQTGAGEARAPDDGDAALGRRRRS